MTRVVFHNDTKHPLRLRIGSLPATDSRPEIVARATAEFEVPDSHDVYVKLWPGALMVRDITSDAEQARRQSRPDDVT